MGFSGQASPMVLWFIIIFHHFSVSCFIAFPDTPIWWGLSSSGFHWRDSSSTKQYSNYHGMTEGFWTLIIWWLDGGHDYFLKVAVKYQAYRVCWISTSSDTPIAWLENFQEPPTGSLVKPIGFPRFSRKTNHKIRPLRHYRNQFFQPSCMALAQFFYHKTHSRPARNWVSPLHRKSCRTSHRGAAEDCADSRRFRVQIWFSHGGLPSGELT